MGSKGLRYVQAILVLIMGLSVSLAAPWSYASVSRYVHFHVKSGMFMDSDGLFRQVCDVLREWGKRVDTTEVYRKYEVKASHMLESEGEIMAPNIVWITHLLEIIAIKQNESVTTSSNTSSDVQYSGRTHLKPVVTWGITKSSVNSWPTKTIIWLARIFILFSF
jgi:hypothetical protein